MLKQLLDLRLSAIFITAVSLLTAVVFSSVALAAIPQAESQNTPLVLAALGNSAKGIGSRLKDYRVKRPEVEDFDFAEAVLATMIKKIDPNKGRESTLGELNQATPGQKALFAVQMMRVTVTELGFIGYLESEQGNLLPEAKRGLKILGAKEYLKIVNEVLKIFKNEKTLITESSNRIEVLNRLSNEEKYSMFDPVDEMFEALEDETVLQTFIIRYVNNNPKHFFVN